MGNLRQEVKRLAAELKAMTAERDALVGAVIEQAIWQVRSSVPGHMMVCDTERICDSIRALTSADATTALDRIRAQAKAEGRKEERAGIVAILEQMPRRVEALGGQRTSYIQLGEAVAAILAASVKETCK